MFQALKGVSKSALILLIMVVGLPILIIIILALLQSCTNKSSYDKYEDKMITAANKYFTKKDLLPESPGESEMVTLDTLVTGEYIKSPEKALKDTNCEGYVVARKNGDVEQLSLTGKVEYNVYLKCDDYKSNTLYENIMTDLTTSGSGLYKDSKYYVYKGEDVKNYLKFYGKTYRIMSVDENQVVKLLSVNDGNYTRPWDDKYNIEVENSYGKTIYKDSFILKMLLDDYGTDRIISKEARQHIVSYDVCIGKRDRYDTSISWDIDCSEKLTNQVVSLMSVSDYARASLDPDCNSIEERSCGNYNYLYDAISNTWTTNAVMDSSYEVFYINSGTAQVGYASDYNPYNMVIYIDGNELVNSGSGSETDPYIIE